MSSQLINYPVPLSTITPWSRESLGACSSSTAPASGSYSSSNLGFFVPFYLYAQATAYGMKCVNGASVSGNIDMGIYSVDGRRLASKGSTAQSGTSAEQTLTFTTPLSMSPGFYFMAIACDNTTATFFRRNTSSVLLKALGMYQATSVFALPATVTYATITTSYVPAFGVYFLNV